MGNNASGASKKTDESGSDTRLKVLLTGNSGFGRSCMLRSMRLQTVIDPLSPKSELPASTIPYDIVTQKVSYYSHPVIMNIFDLASQSLFADARNQHYKEAKAVVISFDVTDRRSLVDVDRWIDEAEGRRPSSRRPSGRSIDIVTKAEAQKEKEKEKDVEKIQDFNLDKDSGTGSEVDFRQGRGKGRRKVPILLCAQKVDQLGSRRRRGAAEGEGEGEGDVLTRDEYEAFARERDLPLVEVSSFTDLSSVQQAFHRVLDEVNASSGYKLLSLSTILQSRPVRSGMWFI